MQIYSHEKQNLELHDGWIEIPLEDCCEVLDSKRVPVNSKERDKRIISKKEEELFPYYGATGQVGWIDDYLLEGEHVLLGEDGAPFLDFTKNNAYLVYEKFWVNNHAHILKAHYSNKYLCHYLNQINFKPFVTGTTRLKLNQSSMKVIPVKMAPLPEQHRIVAKIEELFNDLDNAIESLKKARGQLKTYRQAVLKWAFEGKLTKEWRKENKPEPAEKLLEKIKLEKERHYEEEIKNWDEEVKEWEKIGRKGKKPSKPKKIKDLPALSQEELGELPQLPKEWCWVKFGQLMKASPQNGLYKPSKFYGRGNPIVRIDNFYEGKLSHWNVFKTIEVTKDEIGTYKLEDEEILVNRVNSMPYLGKCALVKNITKECVFESNIMRISIIKNLVRVKYITDYLTSIKGLKELRKNAKQAVNQASINQKDVMSALIPLCTQKEQNAIMREIETRLSICENSEENIEETINKTEALRQSILKKAFEGKLVNQDPNDEPAWELLERIKAEKSSTQTKGKESKNNQLGLKI